MQQQRRQAELVDHVRLVAVAEIADVLGMGHVGLGEQHQARLQHLQHIAQQLDHLVRLRQVDAAGADLFPQIGNGVEADDLGAVMDIEQQNIQKLEQHIRVGEVDIDLVVAERAPNPALAVGRLHRAQQRRGARAGDGAEVGLRLHLDEIVALGGHAVAVGAEPVALAGDVVDDQIQHQPIVLAELLDVVPATQFRVHRAVVDDRKTVVGAVGKERQDVHRGQAHRRRAR